MIVVWGREQDTATPKENLQCEYSEDGDTAGDSPAPSVRPSGKRLSELVRKDQPPLQGTGSWDGAVRT